MARSSPALARLHPPEDTNILRFDDAPEFGNGHHQELADDMDSQVREAQHRLTKLRAEQEEVEQQRKMLENLKQKQDRFISGRKEVTEKLDRSVRSITEELEVARRQVEDLATTEADFRERLDELKSFLPERWHRTQLDQELDKAISALIEAETSFEKGIRRISVNRPAERSTHHQAQHSEYVDEEDGNPSETRAHSGLGSDDLRVWMRRGFAFTLPLMATLILAVVLAKLMF